MKALDHRQSPDQAVEKSGRETVARADGGNHRYGVRLEKNRFVARPDARAFVSQLRDQHRNARQAQLPDGLVETFHSGN